MLTSVLSILLVASAQHIASKVTVPKESLTAPNFELVFFDPAGVIIKWNLTKSDQEPVLGYKVRLWEARGTKLYRFKTVNGTETLVEETKKPELINFSTRDGKLYEYLLTGADHDQLIINHIELDTPYRLQVVAFGASGDGEPSSLLGFQLHSNKDSTPTVA